MTYLFSLANQINIKYQKNSKFSAVLSLLNSMEINGTLYEENIYSQLWPDKLLFKFLSSPAPMFMRKFTWFYYIEDAILHCIIVIY